MLKKVIQSALLLVVLFTTVQSYAQVSQAPDGIQFQALATDANGHPAAGRVIYVKDAIIAKTATGTIVYSETFKVTASSAGIFTIVLGKGTYASGVSSIANIDWANGPFFLNLKIAVEPTVPTSSWNVNNEYVDLGTSQFWSVPYALYAGNVKGADGKLNTSDTAAMLKPYFTAINLKANIESPTFTGTVSGITKAMVGLANVDNTSDLNKPISTATQTALDLKANAADVNTALNLKANEADVNTALALKANATDVTAALNLKSNATDVIAALDLKVDKVTGKALSTNDYTTAEKTKLAAITGTNTGDQANITGNAATATKLVTAKNINGVAFDGSADITVTANAGTLTGTTLASNVVNSSLTSVGTLTSGTISLTTNISTSGTLKAGAITYPNTAGTNGQVLTSNGAGNASWISPTTVSVGTISSTSNANGATITSGVLNLTPADETNGGIVTNGTQIFAGLKTFNDGINYIKVSSSPNLDQSNTTSNAGAGGTSQWQSFTAGVTGILSSVEWRMNTPLIPSAAAPVTIKIYNGEGNSGTLLATVNGSTPSDLIHVYVLFDLSSSNIKVISGQLYTIQLTTPTVQKGFLSLSTSNAYANGRASNDPNWDYMFKTNVRATSTDSYLPLTGGSLTGNLSTSGTITAGVVTYPNTHGANGQVLSSTGNGTLSWTTPSTTATSYSGVLPIENGGTSQTTLPGIKSILGLLSNNIAIGNEAGTPNQGVNANTIAIGGGAGRGNQGASSIAIGYVSGDQNQGANSISIGGNAAQAGQGSQAVAIGYAAGQNSQGANAVAIGTFAGQSGQAANSIAINATGTNTPLNPQNSGLFVDPIRSTTATTNLLFYNTTSKEITAATGNGSFVDLTTNQTIAGIKTFNSNLNVNGLSIGRGNGNNDESVAIGQGAMRASNINGKRNTAVGAGAMRSYNGTSWDNNTSIGYWNMPSLTTGGGNTSVGAETMLNLLTGSQNTSIGNQSLINVLGDNNVGVGKRSGQTITTGSRNTIVGTDADVSVNNLTNATAIGYGANVTASDAIQLGNTSVSNVKTSGTITAGTVTYPNTHGTSGQVLTTSGNGTLNWASTGVKNTYYGFYNALNASNSGGIFYTEHGGHPFFPENLPDGFKCTIIMYSNYAWSSNTLTSAKFFSKIRGWDSGNGGRATFSMPTGGVVEISVITINGQKCYFVSGDITATN